MARTPPPPPPTPESDTDVDEFTESLDTRFEDLRGYVHWMSSEISALAQKIEKIKAKHDTLRSDHDCIKKRFADDISDLDLSKKGLNNLVSDLYNKTAINKWANDALEGKVNRLAIDVLTLQAAEKGKKRKKTKSLIK
jgi:predicted RNase H-like nuclease (RuvC/YqgF family)